MKKKTIGLLLVGILVLSLTACKKTPDPLVVQKDSDRLEQQAQQEPQGNSLRDIAKNIPERYIWQSTSEDGSVTITADAEIKIPDGDSIGSYSVAEQAWSQDEADRFLSMYFPDEDIYDANSVVLGKDYYAEQIIETQEMLATGIGYDGMKLDDYPGLRKSCEDNLAKLQEWYDAAPEKTIPIQPSDGQIRPYDNPDAEPGEFLSICDSQEQRFLYFAAGGPDSLWGAHISYLDIQRGNACNSGELMHHGTEILPGQPLPPEAENISISYEDAKAMAQEAFRALDEDLVLDCAFLMDDGHEEGVAYGNFMPPDDSQPASHWGYLFYFVRQVDGIPIYTMQGPSSKAYDLYTAPWIDERACVLISSDGIVNIDWQSPVQIKEKLSEDTGLISFQESARIFEGIVAARYRGTTVNMYDDSVSPCQVQVNRVSLEFMRVRSGTEREGLLVPAWVYYGTVTRQIDKNSFLADGKPHTAIYGTTEPMAIGAVNAIDGTYISTDDIVS